MWLILRRNFFFYYICRIFLVWTTQLLLPIQLFLWILNFAKLLRKMNFMSIPVVLSEIVIFSRKREVFSKFPRKCFKTIKKLSLAICGTFRGEKQILLIFIPFYLFDQKKLFIPNSNFPQDLLLFKIVQQNKLSENFWAAYWD